MNVRSDHAATSEAQGVGMESPPLRECYNLEQQKLWKRDLDAAQLVHCSVHTTHGNSGGGHSGLSKLGT